MDKKYFPYVKGSVERGTEIRLLAGITAPHGNSVEYGPLQKNYDLINPYIDIIGWQTFVAGQIFKFWKKFGCPPTYDGLKKIFESEGDEKALGDLQDVISWVKNGGEKNHGIPLYSYPSIIELALHESSGDFLKNMLQTAFEIFNSGKKIKCGDNWSELKGRMDFLAYINYGLSRLPGAQALKYNIYREANMPDYLAWPYVAIGETSLLAGPSGVGKTMAILDLLSPPKEKIFGRLDKRQNFRIKIFTELSAPNIRERLDGINVIPDPAMSEICHRNQVNYTDYQSFFSTVITPCDLPQLIIIDNISSWALNVDLMKDTQVADYHIFMRNLATSAHAAILTVCHARKRPSARRDWDEQKLMDDIAGSRLLYALADSVIIIDEVLQDKKRVPGWGNITFHKRLSMDPVWYHIDQVGQELTYHDELPINLEDGFELKQKIINFIGNNSMKARDIATGMNHNYRIILRLLDKMVDEKLMWQNGDKNSPNLTYSIR